MINKMYLLLRKIKLLLLSASFVISLASLAGTALAESSDLPTGAYDILYLAGTETQYNKVVADDTYPQIVGRFVTTFLSLVGVIFTVLFVYAGYLWLTARGEAAAVEKAKNIMENAIIGLVIVAGAYALTYFTVSQLSKGLLDEEASGGNF